MAASSVEDEGDFLSSFCRYADEIDVTELKEGKRNVCDSCRRPSTVCWCPFLPREPLQITTNIYILQHPFEESRRLRTVPMLCRSVVHDRVTVLRGKRFSPKKYPALAEVLRSPNTLLLYPGPGAVDLAELPVRQTSPMRDSSGAPALGYNLVILDGTWAQAKGLYCQNEMMQWPRKVQIHHQEKSKYVIRTQPTDGALSTLETAAVALSILENRPEIVEILTRPLVALCDFQIRHGAVQHQSREYKIENGLWTKPLPRAVRRRLQQQQQQQAQGMVNGQVDGDDDVDFL
ncbi:tRNA-uridine aminocarboxypropyltransferase 2-like [Babylonia areolata]|uniref:tRNA-uridine aminocarboxypropyltransferase 2-like n=1 Tax=Babylonia areolata TaxID=304850 RepID=UPI003FD45C1D